MVVLQQIHHCFFCPGFATFLGDALSTARLSFISPKIIIQDVCAQEVHS